MKNLEVFVPGVPVAQPRMKGAIIAGKIRMYTPNTANKWKDSVRRVVESALQTDPRLDMLTQLQLELSFHLPRAKSHYGTGRNAELLKNSAPDYHTQKPDADNLAKAVMDSLNGVLYPDDSAVVSLVVEKVWCARGEEGCQVTAIML